MNSRIFLTGSLLLLMSSASAQFKTLTGSGFRADVQKVVEDYPHQFSSIRGAEIVTNPQTVEYASLVVPPGVEASSIVRYSSVSKAIYSWQATVLTTESFEEAQKKYKWLYQQVKGLNVKYVADLYTLRGAYEQPSESRKFTTSTLTLHAPPTPLQKLKVEVSLDFEFPEWKVNLLVYEKEREDAERGSTGEK